MLKITDNQIINKTSQETENYSGEETAIIGALSYAIEHLKNRDYIQATKSIDEASVLLSKLKVEDAILNKPLRVHEKENW